MDDFEDGEDESVWTVATCPVGPELAAQIVGLTGTDTDDPEQIFPAVEALGWSSEGLVTDEASFRTAAGHMVAIDGRLMIPFLHEYWVGAEVTPEDFWADVPGWTAHADPEPRLLHDFLDQVVQTFATLLGPPHQDTSTPTTPRRCAAWRVGTDALLVVGSTQENATYAQTDQALIQLGPYPAETPLPDADGLVELIFC